MKKFLLILFVLLPALAFANLFPVQHENGKWGYKAYYDAEKFVVAPKFEDVHHFAGDYAFVCKKGLWGIIGKDGKFAIKPKYASASEPYSGITIIELNGKFGLAKGTTELTAICYNRIKYSTRGSYFYAQSNGKYGLLDGQSGKMLCNAKYDAIIKFNYETFLVKLNGKCGLLDKQGQSLTKVEYDEIKAFEDNYFLVKLNGKCGVLDKNCKTCLEIKYENVTYVLNDTFLIIDDGKLKFADAKGGNVDIPGNVIIYTTTDGCKIDGNFSGLCSHTYENGVGMIVVNSEVTSIRFTNCRSLKSITIPNSVTSIESSAFYGCSSLTSITIPNSVTSIGKYAFSGCYRLTRVNVNISDLARYCTSNPMHSIPGEKHLYLNGKEITNLVIPNSVTSIGDFAFSGCESLTSVTIPDSVTEIGEDAFSECHSLTSVTIPDSVTSIGDSAFCKCISLKSVTIPDSVTSIGERAFCCTSLTRVTIPNSVTSIGSSAFSSCSSLTSVTIPDGVTWIRDGAFFGCKSLTSVTIPDSVTEIGENAFSECHSLTSVTIPDSVLLIGEGAFWSCRSLTNVYCKATTPPKGSSGMFSVHAYGRKIYVPRNSVKAYKSAKYWKYYADDIVGYDF